MYVGNTLFTFIRQQESHILGVVLKQIFGEHGRAFRTPADGEIRRKIVLGRHAAVTSKPRHICVFP